MRNMMTSYKLNTEFYGSSFQSMKKVGYWRQMM